MGKIKYEDKLDAIKFRSFKYSNFKAKASSLNELIDKIKKKRKYKKIKDNKPFIIIEIESLGNDTWVVESDIFPDELSVLDAKRLASSIATHRLLGLSPDLTEIYFEEIHFKIDDCSSTMIYFDYSLLYGNYKPLDLSTPIRSNVPWEMYKTKTSYYIIDKLINDPNETLRIEDLNSNEAYYMYGGDLYDENDKLIGWIEPVEHPIPLSLIYKYIDKGD